MQDPFLRRLGRTTGTIHGIITLCLQITEIRKKINKIELQGHRGNKQTTEGSLCRVWDIPDRRVYILNCVKEGR